MDNDTVSWPPYAVWITRLTLADGTQYDVETTANSEGVFAVVIPPDVVACGPSCLKDPGLMDEYRDHLGKTAPVAFIVDGSRFEPEPEND